MEMMLAHGGDELQVAKSGDWTLTQAPATKQADPDEVTWQQEPTSVADTLGSSEICVSRTLHCVTADRGGTHLAS
jgi:hypothetical protein